MDLLFSMIFGSGFAVIIAIAGIAIFLNFVPLGLWISAIAAGVNVGIFNLIGMRLRRVPASQIVLPLIKANKAGLDVNVNQRGIYGQWLRARCQRLCRAASAPL